MFMLAEEILHFMKEVYNRITNILLKIISAYYKLKPNAVPSRFAWTYRIEEISGMKCKRKPKALFYRKICETETLSPNKEKNNCAEHVSK